MTVSKNLVDEIWKEGRPSLSNATIFPLEMKFTGELHVEDFGIHCRFHCKLLFKILFSTFLRRHDACFLLWWDTPLLSTSKNILPGSFLLPCNELDDIWMRICSTRRNSFDSLKTLIVPMSHLQDAVILLPRPECFIKMLSYSNLTSPLRIKRQLQKLAYQ